MIPALRQQSMMDYLVKTDVASIGNLTELLGVSHMTVRRDIRKLERAGWVKSVAGGVSLARKESLQAPRIDKWNMAMSAEKRAIAMEAEKLLPAAATIFLDAGTTNLALARQIASGGRKHKDLLIVTNDLVIASFMTENSPCSLFFAGGMVERDTRSCVSDAASNLLKDLNLDIAFIAPQSWNSRWMSVPNADKALVKKTVVGLASKRVLVSDSSKYGKVSAFKAIAMTSFDLVISDSGLKREAREALNLQGLTVKLANVSAVDDGMKHR